MAAIDEDMSDVGSDSSGQKMTDGNEEGEEEVKDEPQPKKRKTRGPKGQANSAKLASARAFLNPQSVFPSQGRLWPRPCLPQKELPSCESMAILAYVMGRCGAIAVGF